jgi:tetratricopeptide (TPR) repeat protein
MKKSGLFQNYSNSRNVCPKQVPGVLWLCIGLPLLSVVAVSCAADEQTMQRYAKAKDMYAQGRFSESSAILAEMNNFTPALALRAKTEYFSGDIAKAEAASRMAIRRRPSSFEAKPYLARTLRDKGDLPQAEKMALGLLADNPQDIRTLRFASELAMLRGKNHEAQALLDQAAELSAESAMVFLDRARLHWAAGRNGDALQDLKKAEVMLPWDTPLARSIERLESIIKEAVK